MPRVITARRFELMTSAPRSEHHRRVRARQGLREIDDPDTDQRQASSSRAVMSVVASSTAFTFVLTVWSAAGR
jgi:hypothetical protein